MAQQTMEICNQELADEVIVIEAIHDAAVTVTHSDADHTSIELRLSGDPYAFLLRFPQSYPDQPPIVTAVDNLHLNTQANVRNEVAILQVIIMTCYTRSEVCLHDTISSFSALRDLRASVPPDQLTTLSDLSNPDVVKLREELSVLAETVQTASLKAANSSDTYNNEFKGLINQCAACLEPFFRTTIAHLACQHSFCAECLQSGISSIFQGKGEFRCCGQLIPTPIVSRFGNLSAALLDVYTRYVEEATTAEKVYCSDPTCSTFIPRYRINDTVARCAKCPRATCTMCKTSHHPGRWCRVETNKFKNLMKKENWKQCPGCEMIVERIDGCKSIKCPCGTVFCFHCGKQAPPGVLHPNKCCLGGRMWDTMVVGLNR